MRTTDIMDHPCRIWQTKQRTIYGRCKIKKKKIGVAVAMSKQADLDQEAKQQQ